MTSSARISTPIYLDPAQGPHCGSCQLCEMDDPYVPSRMAVCNKHDRAVKISTKTTCTDYLPRQAANEQYLLNLEAQ